MFFPTNKKYIYNFWVDYSVLTVQFANSTGKQTYQEDGDQQTHPARDHVGRHHEADPRDDHK